MTTVADVLSGSARWCLITGDCRDVLPTLPDKSVGHVVTDPPYDARTHERARSLKDGGSDIKIDFDPTVDFGFVRDLVRVARRWVVAFCALEQLGTYQEAAGLSWVRAAVWNRTNGTPQISGDRPAQGAEGLAIMHNLFVKKRWRGGGNRGLWTHGVERENRHHPTPKPVPLMLELVELFTDPDEVVLDPFAGSGTTGVACLRLGRRFIGIEKDAGFAQVATERLQADLRAPVSTPGRARATANQIKAMWGEILIEGDILTRTGMYGRKEVWIRVPGATGATAVYEKEGED